MIKVGFVQLENYPIDVPNVQKRWSFAHEGDACADIYAAKLTILEPGETKIIPTGVKLEIPEGYELQIRPRSGMSSKGKFVTLGTVEYNYKGEIGVCMYNSTSQTIVVQRGERVAQAAIRPVPEVEFYNMVEEDLSESNRGSNGFGSTGA